MTGRWRGPAAHEISRRAAARSLGCCLHSGSGGRSKEKFCAFLIQAKSPAAPVRTIENDVMKSPFPEQSVNILFHIVLNQVR